jgi:hypothetical protein
MQVDSVLKDLTHARIRTEQELACINQAIANLGPVAVKSTNGARTGRSGSNITVMSAAGRQKISDAQKARWANRRKQAKSA